MAWLVLKDGRRAKIGYGRAAVIFQLLSGKKELDKEDPEYEKKEAFLSTVDEVVFDDTGRNRYDRPWEKWKKTGK